MPLRDLQGVAPIYLLPQDDLIGEVLIPGLRRATRYDCMIGYFGSGALRQLAPGLAEFLSRSNGPMRLLVSPHLSAEDRMALEEGSQQGADVLKRALEQAYGQATLDAGALVQHTLRCLAYLVALGRLQFKVVIVRDGLFHPKVWLLDDGMDRMAVHGSNNLTSPGLGRNVEQVSVSRAWTGPDPAATVDRLDAYFRQLWESGHAEGVRVYDFPDALAERLIRDYRPARPPSAGDFDAARQAELRARASRDAPEAGGFSLPEGLDFTQGDFAHQGAAVEAWEGANGRGFLEMATGSGKTITSFIAAHRVWQHERRGMLLVIAAPYLPLVAQWAREATRFGLRPIVPGSASDRAAKLSLVQRAVRSLRIGGRDVQCLVVTHDFLAHPEFAAELGRVQSPAMLIADEAHNLGTARFLAAPPEIFGYRLALSATPVRQYDPEGTAGLLAYFGDVVFRFTLANAIGRCLVPYRYHLHEVPLREDELEEWISITAKLRTSGWRRASDDDAGGGLPDRIQRLLSGRRRVVEQAANKLDVFDRVIAREDRRSLRHMLVYASDKGRAQLSAVNALLMDRHGLRVHQLTQEETSDPGRAARLLADFSSGGGIQVLTAMRVLDEGVDIPEVETAHILASTTVERQWVQRRGRVLRKCPRTGKESATIHDYVVVPPATRGASAPPEITSLLRGELDRAREFATLALNAGAQDGPLRTISNITHEYF